MGRESKLGISPGDQNEAFITLDRGFISNSGIYLNSLIIARRGGGRDCKIIIALAIVLKWTYRT